MKKPFDRKLSLKLETLAHLQPDALAGAVGGQIANPQLLDQLRQRYTNQQSNQHTRLDLPKPQIHWPWNAR